MSFNQVVYWSAQEVEELKMSILIAKNSFICLNITTIIVIYDIDYTKIHIILVLELYSSINSLWYRHVMLLYTTINLVVQQFF